MLLVKASGQQDTTKEVLGESVLYVDFHLRGVVEELVPLTPTLFKGQVHNREIMSHSLKCWCVYFH